MNDSSDVSYRLTTLTTRTGDEGHSGLADGSRHVKSHPRFAALGAVDELNSLLGMLLSILPESIDGCYRQFLCDVQHHLFELGSELAMPAYLVIDAEAVLSLEAWTTHFQQFLSPLKEFILPAGHASASMAHVARTVCRRAEREVIALHVTESQRLEMRQYLNRLSDTLFAFSRFLNQQSLTAEALWQPKHRMALPPVAAQ